MRFLFLVLVCLPNFAHGEARPGQTWKTVRTENFHVHYTPPQEKFAHAFVNTLERALPALKKDLDWDPKTPIDIVVNDMADSANGMAISFPNTHIEAFPVPFDVDSTLSDYINWVDVLAIHELTHIVANDTTTGFYKILRSIFGSVIKPNGLQPDWLVEGLAVFEETRLTRAGRGRAAITEAILRASVREERLDHSSYLTLDRLNQGPFFWPAGNTPYLLGYALQASVQGDETEKGNSFPGRFSKQNSKQFPFTPNTVLDDLEGYRWDEAWKRFAAKVQHRYDKEPAETRRCKLTNGGRFTGIPALAPDGFLYFVLESADEGGAIARVKPDAPCGGTGVEILVRKRGLGTPTAVSLSSDGRFLLYTDVNLEAEGFFPYDIYAFDIEKKSSRRITHAERLYDPAFIPGTHNFYAVHTNDDNTQAIAQVTWDPKENSASLAFSSKLKSKPFERLSGLAATKDALYFSRHDNNGHEELQKFTYKGEALTAAVTSRPTNGYFFERQARFDEQSGKIFFSANYHPFGAENEYSVYYLNEGMPVRVQSSPSGYVRGIVNTGKGVIVNDYDTTGFNLYRESERSTKRALPHDQDLHSYLSGNAKDTIADHGKPISSPEDYNATKSPAISLWPQYWIPVILSSYGGTLAGVQTSGNDPLDYQSYEVSLLWDSRTTFPTYNISYLNRAARTFFRMGGEQKNDYLSSLHQSNRQAVYFAEVFYPASYWLFGAGTAFENRSYLGTRVQNGQIYQVTRYHDIKSTPAAIVPNRGLDALLHLVAHPSTRFEPSFGELRTSFEAHSPGVSSSHSLLFELHGGFSSNRLLASNFFKGGGPSSVSSSPYVVHGYPVDALLGQRITTVQSSYTMPLAHVYRGWNTNPVFMKSVGLRAVGDAGTATFLSEYQDRGKFFLGYSGQKFGRKWVAGAGLDFLLTGTAFHHVPVEVVLGYHHGFNVRYGGTNIAFLGLNLGGGGVGSVFGPKEKNRD